ncbi:hypothetical protein AA106555_0138 [Neokomagataea thailandica NBRC 106555]|uniref:Uncharacterized protein n=1 Tax=Neokomagataea thailandica NBRC 106555 TaxID=1223520 RepID=A0ABQ0QMA6_9PROT|nr:hypothetical protein AA106555_0138 [Neokomagataea thailandica NBRC 106555]
MKDIETLLAADKDMIGGAYPLKSHYWDDNTDRFIQAGEHPHTASLRYVGDCAALYDTSQPTHLVQVSYVGTGFMLIKRAALLQMTQAYPETEYTRIDAQQSGHFEAAKSHTFALFDCLICPATKTYLSEDFAFCKRWKDIGGSIWLHRSLSLSHVGPATFQGAPAARTMALKGTP